MLEVAAVRGASPVSDALDCDRHLARYRVRSAHDLFAHWKRSRIPTTNECALAIMAG